MDRRPPQLWRNLRDELVLGDHWIDRAVVLVYAVLTGLVVVGGRRTADSAYW